jgi:hypothetical protein
MKKIIWVFTFVLLLLSNNIIIVEASNKHESKEYKEQANDHFMLSILSNEIQKAVANYYKEEQVSVGSPDSIFIKYGHDNHDDVVKLLQSEKGHELENSFVVKINVTPQRHGMLGRDTITFGVEPENKQGDIKINMLEYKHTALKNNK